MNFTKLFFLSATVVFLFTIGCGSLKAQNKMIILVRHAEKADATSADPELSADGKRRAERLVKVLGKYKPGAFYSTDFKRTRDTARPFADKRKKTIETYDARKPNELIDAIMKSKTKRFLITGHSNTIPGLANALGKKDLFKNLDDSEYGVIWIVRIKNGQVDRIEILPF